MSTQGKPHILFLSHYFPPEGNAPASRTFEHCRRWVEKGCRVSVITCAPNVPRGKVYPGYRNRLSQSEVVEGIEVIRVWTWLAANKGTAGRILNYLTYLFSASVRGVFIRKPDIVIATSPQFFCGWAGVLVSFLRRKPFLLEIRDIWPESIETVGALKGGLALRFLGLLERWMYRAADRIVTVGQGYKTQLIRRGVAEDAIEVIPNGVDPEVFSPGEPSRNLIERFDLEDKFTIAYVGTVGMACGLDILIDAGKILRESGRDEILFLVVGDGARRDELEERAHRENLDNVRFAGLLPKEEIPGLLRSIDLCLVHLRDAPLFRSVLPSKIFEAFATERAVILGVAGDAAELLENARGGIPIPPEDGKALAETALTLFSHPRRVEEMGENGRAFALEHFQREGLADQYLKIVKSMTS